MTTLVHQMRRLASTAAAAHTNFSAELLCSAANRRLCIERLQGMPAIRLGVAPTDASGAERTAAVLVPLCTDPASGELSVLYTLRSARLAAHTGQVSFAGGMRDATDASFEACAVREAGEEIGLAAEQIDIWGQGQLIHPHNTPSIMPIVAYLHNYQPSALRLNADEVAEAFTVPLSRLSARPLFGHTQFRRANGRGYSVPVFLGGPHRIWGLTAVMTHLFLMALLPPAAYGRRAIPFVRR